jgi:hypothetical protein
MSLIPFPSQNAITTIFGVINTHLYDNFQRLNNQSLGKFNNDFQTEVLNYINHEQERNNLHSKFNLVSLSDFVYKLFNQFDPNESGDLQLNLIRHAKNHLVPWFNENLKDFCTNFTVSIQNTRLPNSNSIIPNSVTTINETQQVDPNLVQNNSETASSSSSISNIQSLLTTNNNSDSVLVSKADLRELLSEFTNNNNKYLDNFFSKSISTSTKEQHFNELKNLTQTLVHFSNAKSINEAHTSAKVFPKCISKENFPTGLYNDDPQFRYEFEELILSFQNQLMSFTNKHQSKIITETESLIQEKLKFIEIYDNSIKSKYSILKDEVVKKLKPSLEIGMEKVNKIILNINKSPKPKTKKKSNPNSKVGSRSTSPIIINDNNKLNKSNSSNKNNNQNRQKTNVQHATTSKPNNVRFTPKTNESNNNRNQISTFDTPYIRQYNKPNNPNLFSYSNRNNNNNNNNLNNNQYQYNQYHNNQQLIQREPRQTSYNLRNSTFQHSKQYQPML